jgi:hypothetical protein
VGGVMAFRADTCAVGLALPAKARWAMKPKLIDTMSSFGENAQPSPVDWANLGHIAPYALLLRHVRS